jgi:putative endonuclease
VTNDLARRIYEHKQELVPGFTSRYKIRHLIYVEEFVRADRSYCQEKQLKGWTRKRKLALAESANPTMRDLSAPSLRD